ncbi:hypothetical protein [uncultured Helicobacter sp.]
MFNASLLGQILESSPIDSESRAFKNTHAIPPYFKKLVRGFVKYKQ